MVGTGFCTGMGGRSWSGYGCLMPITCMLMLHIVCDCPEDRTILGVDI